MTFLLGWSKSMCIALIDADMIRYTAGFVSDRPVYKVYPINSQEDEGHLIAWFYTQKDLDAWKREYSPRQELKVVRDRKVMEWNEAKEVIDGILKAIRKEVGCDSWMLFLSPSTNFRHRVAVSKPYKERNTEKPYWHEELGLYLVEVYRAKVCDDIEADDALGIHATQLHNEGIPCVMVAEDKDLNCISGWKYNPKKKVWNYVSEEESVKNLFTQTLTGDPTDGIPGLPGVGTKKAEKILTAAPSVGDIPIVVAKEYVDRLKDDGLTYLAEQFALVNILSSHEAYDEVLRYLEERGNKHAIK